MCSAGDRHAGVRIGSPVAGGQAGGKPTVLKPLDNPTRGVGASCSGRNESEREVAPKVRSPGGRARNREGEGSTTRCKPIDRAGRSGGVVIVSADCKFLQPLHGSSSPAVILGRLAPGG